MNQSDDIGSEHLWVYDSEVSEQLCVALVEGCSIEQVLQGLAPLAVGPVQPAADLVDWRESDPEGIWSSRTYVEAFTRAGWVVAVDWDGWNATDGEILLPLSVGTRVAVIFWNVNGVLTFDWAVDGTVVRSIGTTPRQVPASELEPLPEERGLPFDMVEDDGPEPRMDHKFFPLPSLLTLMQRLTGVRLTQADIEKSDPTRLAIPYHF